LRVLFLVALAMIVNTLADADDLSGISRTHFMTSGRRLVRHIL
jgi:hypothetical protein